MLTLLPLLLVGWLATRYVQQADELGREQATASSAYAGELARSILHEELRDYFRPRREKLVMSHMKGSDRFSSVLRDLYLSSDLLDMPQFLSEEEVRAWPREGERPARHQEAHVAATDERAPWEQALARRLQDFMAGAGQELLVYDAGRKEYRGKSLVDEGSDADWGSRLGWIELDLVPEGTTGACSHCEGPLENFGSKTSDGQVAILALAFPLPGRPAEGTTPEVQAGMFGATVPVDAAVERIIEKSLARWEKMVRAGDEKGQLRHGVQLVDAQGERLAPQKPTWPTEAGRIALWSSPLLGAASPWRLEAFPVEAEAVAQLAAQGKRWSLFFGVAVILVFLGGLLLATGVTQQVEDARVQAHLLGNISHELKTPLSLIRLYSDTLSEGRYKGEEQAQRFQGIIGREAKRLTHLIDNLLDIQRIEEGRKQYSFAQIRPGKVVRETVEAYRYRLVEEGFELRLDIDDELPLMMLDGEALAQAMINLLDNAAKYSDVHKEVRVRCQVDGDNLRISVRDRGIGIPRAEQERIFERFYRVEQGLVHDVKGSGLGLAVVEHVAAAHGGRVDLESTPGKGSRFSLLLPVEFHPEDD